MITNWRVIGSRLADAAVLSRAAYLEMLEQVRDDINAELLIARSGPTIQVADTKPAEGKK